MGYCTYYYCYSTPVCCWKNKLSSFFSKKKIMSLLWLLLLISSVLFIVADVVIRGVLSTNTVKGERRKSLCGRQKKKKLFLDNRVKEGENRRVKFPPLFLRWSGILLVAVVSKTLIIMQAGRKTSYSIAPVLLPTSGDTLSTTHTKTVSTYDVLS